MGLTVNQFAMRNLQCAIMEDFYTPNLSITIKYKESHDA